jgi:rRNA maturation RNase YbeY
MIRFSNEDIDFNLLSRRGIKTWLKTVVEDEGKRVGDITLIFCSAPFLLRLNRRYLQHDYGTDIITFDYTEDLLVGGDLFISIDTVRANGERYKQPFSDELHRVILHGVLHLCGFGDFTAEQKEKMREMENKYLATRPEVLINPNTNNYAKKNKKQKV